MKNKREQGSLIVEASIVFPVVFFVLFILIFMGNIYYQRSKAQAVMTELAIKYAAQYSNPVLDQYIEDGSLPTIQGDAGIKPYRYVFPSEIEGNIENDLVDKLKGMGSGLFTDMDPADIDVEVEYRCYGIYASEKVSMSYNISLPIKMIWQDEAYKTEINEYIEMCAIEGSEMVRNTTMIMDILEQYGVNGFESFIKDTENGLGNITNFIN